jgi:hypothetical protein
MKHKQHQQAVAGAKAAQPLRQRRIQDNARLQRANHGRFSQFIAAIFNVTDGLKKVFHDRLQNEMQPL